MLLHSFHFLIVSPTHFKSGLVAAPAGKLLQQIQILGQLIDGIRFHFQGWALHNNILYCFAFYKFCYVV